MIQMDRRTTGGRLLALGIVLVIAGGILWAVENHRVHKHNTGVDALAGEMTGSITGIDPFTPAKANHAPSIVLWVIGGGAALFGMLLLAGTPGTAGALAAPPPFDDRLSRLAQLHDEGALSDAEYEQAKQRVLAEPRIPEGPPPVMGES